ncbi:MAG: hypothetical protein HUU35_10445, partial [Armatimonadetes bacterium]|nr:hypothetical protein [Armatimonadota bacterium]
AMALQAGPDKRLLRRAARGQLPESLLARPKRRRWRPDATWLLADPLPEPLAQVVSPQALGALGWFDPVTFHYWLGFVRARPREPLNQLRCRLLVTATALQWLAVRSQAS